MFETAAERLSSFGHAEEAMAVRHLTVGLGRDHGGAVASALPYANERAVQLAMKLGGDYRLHVQRSSTWTTMATDLGVDADQLRERASRLVMAAPDAFSKVATEVEPLGSHLPARLTDAVAERARRCAHMVS